MTAATRIVLVALVSLLQSQAAPASSILSVTLGGESSEDRFALRGLSLDLEACLNGDCIRASDGRDGASKVYLAAGDAGPVRIRLHLDCEEAKEVRGISRIARVILVPAGARSLECALEPINATCEFRFWEDEDRWRDDIVADYTPWSAETAWPDADGRVDEAEIVLDATARIPVGEYDLIAALPKELVDEYPCENIRNHAWVESPRLRVVITDRRDLVEWVNTLSRLEDAGSRGELEAVRDAIDRLRKLAREAPAGVLPPPSDVETWFVMACPWLGDTECANLLLAAGPPVQAPDAEHDLAYRDHSAPDEVVEILSDVEGVELDEAYFEEFAPEDSSEDLYEEEDGAEPMPDEAPRPNAQVRNAQAASQAFLDGLRPDEHRRVLGTLR